MNSEKNNDYIICLSPSSTEEQIAEWEKMVEKLEERSRNTDEMANERACCGNCSHHTPPWKNGQLSGWTCCNEQSDNYGLTTEYGDCCKDYEERE